MTANVTYRCAPFVYEAWHNPDVLRLISAIAGIELVPAMDLDIAHINLSAQSQDTMEEEPVDCECSEDDDKNALVGWHKDSYPFVCVVMLSDCSQMIGGETALRTGTGEIMKVRGPEMVRLSIKLQNKYQMMDSTEHPQYYSISSAYLMLTAIPFAFFQ